MWPFDEIGGSLGGQLKDIMVTSFEAAMKGLWIAALWLLRESFQLVDQLTVFTVDTRTGPISVLWPMMLWISGILALGLFFWQLTSSVVRGGRGFTRLIVGPVQYGIALAVTVGVVAAFLAGVDGVTEGILNYGLQAENFNDALDATGFLDAAGDTVNTVVLGIVAVFFVIPAAIGYILEMLFREAAIYLLVATIPISAAGLLSVTTATWFWRAVRWLLACSAMKPLLALSLTLGVGISGGSQGVTGFLAGLGVLLISLGCPFVLFRLFAFVDPRSDAGAAFRDSLSSRGVDSYGANNPAVSGGKAVFNALLGGGGSSAQEDANTSRFDEATGDYAGDEMDKSGTGRPSDGDSSSDRSAPGGERDTDGTPSTDSGAGGSSGTDSADADDDAAAPLPADSDSVVPTSSDSGSPGGSAGDDSSSSGSSSSSGGGGAKSGGGGKGTAAGAEDVAVIV